MARQKLYPDQLFSFEKTSHFWVIVKQENPSSNFWRVVVRAFFFRTLVLQVSGGCHCSDRQKWPKTQIKGEVFNNNVMCSWIHNMAIPRFLSAFEHNLRTQPKELDDRILQRPITIGSEVESERSIAIVDLLCVEDGQRRSERLSGHFHASLCQKESCKQLRGTE